MKKTISKGFWADRDIEMLVGQLLRIGVVTASSIVLIGGVFFLFQHGNNPLPSYRHFTGEAPEYITFTSIVAGAARLKSKEIIQLGVIVLMATPILRIIFSLFGFILEKDKLYIAITAIVLAVMSFSIFGGLKI